MPLKIGMNVRYDLIKNNDPAAKRLIITVKRCDEGPTTDAWIKCLGRAMGKNTNLKILELHWPRSSLENDFANHTDAERCALLFRGINHNKSIEVFTMKNIGVFGESIGMLRKFLRLNPKLKSATFDLYNENTTVDRDGLISVMRSIIHRSYPIEKIHFNGRQFRNDEVTLILSAFHAYPTKTPGFVGFSHTEMTSNCCKRIAKVLKLAQFSLDLSSNNVGDKGVIAILSVLRRSPGLCPKSINLKDSCIGQKSYSAIADLLRDEECSLEEINIETTYSRTTTKNQQIELAELQAITFSMIGRNKPMEYVNLSGHKFGDDGMEVLAATFLENPQCTPRVLRLRSNNIGEVGYNAIVRLLQNPHCSIQTLDLTGLTNRRMKIDMVIALVSALRGNKHCQVLRAVVEWGAPDCSDAFESLVYDTSSIDTLYNSNHTLREISINKVNPRVKSIVNFNTTKNKKMLARQKVVTHFFPDEFDVVPFQDLEPALLVFFLAAFAETSEMRNANKSLGSVFYFMRNIPHIFD